jgi:uncharacterized protein (TIGR02246 family)
MSSDVEPAAGGESSSASAQASDEQQIRAIWDRMAKTWTKNDARGYALEFTEDSDYVAFEGTRLRGRDANEQHHRRLFETVLKGTRLEGEVESVRFLGPDVAVMHLVGAVIFPWQRRTPKRRLSRQTCVVVRRDGRWQVTAFQNARIRPVRMSGPGFAMATKFLAWRAALARRR